MRVLMTTMQLDIGGAETHIIELSKALKRRGTDVTVASNGGAYEAELAEAGIPHVKIPFHSKNPMCMYRAYKLLKELIFKEKFDIVHAHARIPAFLCAMLHKRYHFRFVTTAHWVFSTRFPYNLLTRWGERSLAVSDDIKKYLIDNYGIVPENIRVTINGIDLNKFSKDTDYSDIAKEFSLADGKKRIVYVSRMDTDRSLAAHKLIGCAEDIIKTEENTEIVIVGGGNDYDSIKSEADAVNQKLGRRVIITTGSRTDINKFTASGDIFIGVSRAALEAMACEKPSIIAGNEGYIGIFDEDKLKEAIDTNFCCRGCGETTTEKLKKDILHLLSSPSAELKKLGKYARDTVAEHYSMDTMADDAVKMYVSVIKNTLINETSAKELDTIDEYLTNNPLRIKSAESDVVISGYYGFGNSGDDSILYAIVRELKLKDPSVRIVTLSNTPKATQELYGVDAVHRFNFVSVCRRLRHTKLLISGGGSLIQDVTSNKSLAYYLTVIALAKRFGKKVMLYANGIGPISNAANHKRIHKVLNSVDMITLREPSSLEELKRFGIYKPRILVTSDPAFNLFPADETEVSGILSSMGLADGSKYCVIALRPWKTLKSGFSEVIAQCADYIKSKYNIDAVFVCMQPAKDFSVTNAAVRAMSGKGYILNNAYTTARLLGVIRDAEFVIGMRLHTLIYAASVKTPVIGISYDPKIDAMMDYMGQEYRLPADNPNPLTLQAYIDKIIENRAEISLQLAEVAEKAAEKASENAVLALSLIKE